MFSLLAPSVGVIMLSIDTATISCYNMLSDRKWTTRDLSATEVPRQLY